MNIDIKEILAWLKTAPKSLKIILGIVVADVILIFISYMMFDDLVAERQNQVTALNQQIADQKRQADQVRIDINRLPELRRRYESAISEGILGQRDRPKLVQAAQDIGARYRVNDIRYKFDADKLSPIPNSKYQISSTSVIFDDSGIVDGDILNFWNGFLPGLPGYYQVTEATIERVHDIDNPVLSDLRSRKPVILVNGHLALQWVSLLPPEGAQ